MSWKHVHYNVCINKKQSQMCLVNKDICISIQYVYIYPTLYPMLIVSVLLAITHTFTHIYIFIITVIRSSQGSWIVRLVSHKARVEVNTNLHNIHVVNTDGRLTITICQKTVATWFVSLGTRRYHSKVCIGLDCICLTTTHVLKDILAVFHK